MQNDPTKMFKVPSGASFDSAEYDYLGKENNSHKQLPLAMSKPNNRAMGDVVVGKNHWS